MRFRPPAVTDAGRRACELAETVGASWKAGAAPRDVQARFDRSLVDEARRCGLASCCVPVELGGLGVEALRDVMAVVYRLAECDASMALVVHMHLSSTWSLSRRWRACADDDQRKQDDGEALLRLVANGSAWLCAAVTEAGTNFFHPKTTLRPQPEGGWILQGTKVFATGSPAATHFSVNARITAGPHADHLAQVFVPAHPASVVVEDNWNGLGMRASGSGSVEFDDVVLAARTPVVVGGRYGTFTAAALCGRAFGNVGNVTAMAGIAAAAHTAAVERVRGGSRVSSAALAERPTVRASLAELEADAFALAAVIDYLGRRADSVAERMRVEPGGVTDDEARWFMADFQSAKLNVTRLSTSVVDRALSLAGGAGYTNTHPLSRHVRDVRAGQFMQPFSPHEALGYIGAVAAGTAPDVEA